MKAVILLCLFAVAAARPQNFDFEEVVPILRNERVENENGAYSFDFETGDGIERSEAGQSQGETGAVNQSGDIKFTFPSGQEYYLKFVADEFGYKPESEWLPVAPAFPHPIPQYVLDQIAFAAEEDRDRPLEASRGDYVGF